MKFFYYDNLEAKKNKLEQISVFKYFVIYMICSVIITFFVEILFLNFINDEFFVKTLIDGLFIVILIAQYFYMKRKKYSKCTYCLEGSTLYKIRIMRFGFINSIVPGLMDEGRFINIINHYNETQEILSYDNLGLVRVKKYCNVSMYKNKKKCIVLKYNNFNLNKKMKIPKCYKNIENMFN